MLQRRIFVRTVADLAARLPRVEVHAANQRYAPELVNRFFDLETIQKRGSFLLLDGLSVLLSVLVGLVVLAFYHPLLLAFDVLLLVIIAVIVFGPIVRGVKSAKAESAAKYEVAAWLEELARNPVSMKTAGAIHTALERSDALSREYLERRGTHFRIAFGQGVAAIGLQILASTALLGIGGLLVIQGSLTLGQLVAAELILTLVVSSVAKIGKHLEAFYDLMAATDKVGMVLDVPLERTSGDRMVPGSGRGACSVGLDHVTLENPNGAALLRDASLEVRAGEQVVLRGSSDGGRVAILEALWSLRNLQQGSAQIDGFDARELSLEVIRGWSSLLTGVEVIDGTLRENVHLGRSSVTREAVRDALERTGLLGGASRRCPTGIRHPGDVSDGRPLAARARSSGCMLARAIVGAPARAAAWSTYSRVSKADERAIRPRTVLIEPADRPRRTLDVGRRMPSTPSRRCWSAATGIESDQFTETTARSLESERLTLIRQPQFPMKRIPELHRPQPRHAVRVRCARWLLVLDRR